MIAPEERGQCQEVRLAVVMYGGVSLAIYINGVSQELLRLVRATAIEPSGNAWERAPSLAEPQGTEKIYRKLGQMLRRNGTTTGEPPDGAPILTSFVVDVLSGTSAGGINAVYLAKALRLDAELEPLRRLWLREGDLGLLVNDAGSLKDLPDLRKPSPPRSLLNSQRMFRMLLSAFEDMDKGKEPPLQASPYVDSLDLYVTTTDLRGSAVPLRLADGIVYERRFKNVFHFGYDSDRGIDDFGFEANHFLALAARATSAFPFAFEPMTVEQAGGDPDDARWSRFMRRHLHPIIDGPGSTPPARRVFGDGGVLDNKPFSYAIDALARREEKSRVPIDRKLVFVEPAPSVIPLDGPAAGPPDAIENVLLTLFSIPRHETIREDLEAMVRRNRLTEFVDVMLNGMEHDVQNETRKPPLKRGEFVGLDLAAMIQREGVAYGGYQRLKVHNLTDEIASIFAAAGGFDPESAEFEAIRAIARAWRERHYVAYYKKNPVSANAKSHNRFLVEFDLPFRIRRVEFVRDKVDELLRLDDAAREILWHSGYSVGEGWPDSEQEKLLVSDDLTRIRQDLVEVLRDLKRMRETLLSAPVVTEGGARPSSSPALRETLRAAGLDTALLHRMLTETPYDDLKELGEKVYRAESTKIDEAVEILRIAIEGATVRAKARCDAALGTEDLPPQNVRRLVRGSLRYYYDTYDKYDMVRYPILHATDVGEERDRIEVLRISPLDARALWDEAGTPPKRKLAGTTLHNFGAFLDHDWRWNDYLWGRLDGAERLISAMLPRPGQKETRARLIEEAHRAIIVEEFSSADTTETCSLITRAIVKAKAGGDVEKALRELVGASPDGVTHPAVEAVLLSALEDDVLYQFFRDGYAVDRNLDRAATLRVASRATRVVGRMLEDMAHSRNVGAAQTRWISRFAQAFWGFVEVAVPGSFASLVFQHILKVLYAFEAFLFFGGWALGYDTVQRFGLVSLGATLTLHVFVLMLEDFIRRRRTFTILVGAFAIGVVLAYAALGAVVAFAPATWALLGVDLGLEAWLTFVWRYPLAPLAGFGVLVGLAALGRPVLAWVRRTILRLVS